MRDLRRVLKCRAALIVVCVGSGREAEVCSLESIQAERASGAFVRFHLSPPSPPLPPQGGKGEVRARGLATLSRVIWIGKLTCASFLLGLLLLDSGLATAGEPLQLTHDGRAKFTTLVLPEGQEAWYVEYETPRIYRLMKVNLKTGATARLHPEAVTGEFEPAMSADGKAYAYLKLIGALRISVVVRERNGTQLYEIPPGEGLSGLRGPALSPDHATLAYVFPDAALQHIHLATNSGATRRQFTSGANMNHWPNFSPDGKRIVFGSNRDGNYELYSADLNGNDLKRLTNSPYQDIRPKFSPDGRRIAFVSHRDNNFEIYVMNADGSSPVRITHNVERDDYPSWHPNGKQLLVVSERDGRHDLYFYDVPQ